jgi:hypothetical protein
LPDWITIDEARALAWRSGATDWNLNEILGGALRGRRIGITALLEHAPIVRVHVHWPGRAAELDVMRLWFTPQHIEEFLKRAIGPVCVEPDNRLRAMILWGDGAPPYEADTCLFGAVHLYRPALVFELEAAGFTVSSATETVDAIPKKRGAYRGALENWLAREDLKIWRRMQPEAITRAFADYCKAERPDLLPLLPKRLRSMESMIERIIKARRAAAKALAAKQRPSKEQ